MICNFYEIDDIQGFALINEDILREVYYLASFDKNTRVIASDSEAISTLKPIHAPAHLDATPLLPHRRSDRISTLKPILASAHSPAVAHRRSDRISTLKFMSASAYKSQAARLRRSDRISSPTLYLLAKPRKLWYNIIKIKEERLIMVPKVFGKEHILYAVISTLVGAASLVIAKIYCKTEKSQAIALKSLALILVVSVMTNRMSQVFRYEQTRWYCIIPDSFCAMTSLVLGLAVIFGKKNNDVLHFCWLLGLFGGIATVVYPTFVSQHVSFFYIPTFTGLLHHSFSAMTVIALLLFNQITLTYKKWYCVILGFTCYLTVGAFLMSVFGMSDAFHIVEPLLPDTNLTAWVMAPMYLPAHALIIAVVEVVRHYKSKAQNPPKAE